MIYPNLKLVVYTGRNYDVWYLLEDENVDVSDDLVDIQSFLSKFHATWDFMKDMRVAYESKVIDNAIPVFLRWRDPSEGNNDLFNIDITFIYVA